MTDARLRLASAVLALSGAALAGYLLWVRETKAALLCATGGCETVQGSPYAEAFGVPVALIGLVGYLLLLACAARPGETARLVQASLALGAAIFSTYLLYVQVDLIGAVCDWCLASDAITGALAVASLLRLRLAQLPSSSSPAESA